MSRVTCHVSRVTRYNSLDPTSEQLLPRDAAVESLREELNDGFTPLLPEPRSAIMMMMVMMTMTMMMMMVPGLDVLAVVHEQPQPPCQLAAPPPGQPYLSTAYLPPSPF